MQIKRFILIIAAIVATGLFFVIGVMIFSLIIFTSIIMLIYRKIGRLFTNKTVNNDSSPIIDAEYEIITDEDDDKK